MLDGGGFRRRVTVAIALAYFLPPIIGLGFLATIARAFTFEQLGLLMSQPILPSYIVGSAIGAIVLFRWFLDPVGRFADGEVGAPLAMRRMRSFVRLYWVVFLLRHFFGAFLVLMLSEAVLHQQTQASDWVRMVSLSLMLSSVVGLPVFVYMVDFFADAFGVHALREPVLRLRTRVFLIAVLLPTLLNSAVLQYLVPRLGGLTTELVILWLALLLIAVIAAYNLMRSLDQSVAGLRRVSQSKGDARSLHPEALRVRSMDEFGVLTSEYRDLIADLKQQSTLMELRNQVLLASNNAVDAGAVFCELLRIVARQTGSERSHLVSLSSSGVAKNLATVGDCDADVVRCPELIAAIRGSEPSHVDTCHLPPGCSGVVVIPLNESSSSEESVAMLAYQAHQTPEAPEQHHLMTQLMPEIAAAVRAARVNEEKLKLEKRLHDAQRMEVVGRLAAGVAHDFNNILTVIISSAGLLKMEADESSDAPLDDLVVEQADLIVEASDRAAELTRQLMTFSRPNEGKARILDINAVIRSLDKFLRRLLGDDVSLGMNLTSRGAIRADKGHIEQVITNLVVNARDAMPDGGQLRIDTQQDQDWLEVRVVDSGTGMSPEIAAHVFEPFFTTKPQDKGTGLGLATVYGIVKNYGGMIEIHSAEGEGTEMLVRLPMTSESPLRDSADRKADDTARAQTGPAVLLVEDDPRILRIVQKILLGAGYRVTPASDGAEAVEKISDSSLQVDLLLTDVAMPKVNGIEVARQMAEQHPTTNILLMTGYADAQMLKTAEEAGRAIINKPFKPAQLLRRIEELLQQ